MPRARLRAWARLAWRHRHPARSREARLDFRDLLELRRLAELRAQGISLRRIRRSIEQVRRHLPEVERPLEVLQAAGLEGSPLVVRLPRAVCEPSGQLLLDWSGAEGAEGRIAELRDAGRRRSPERALHWFERGCALDSEPATHAEALEAYQRALEADPEFADAHCNLGSLHHQRGERRAARRCYEAALRSEPLHPEANLNLAVLLEEEGEDGSALRRYKMVLRTHPLRTEVHLGLALLYEKLGARGPARRHWRIYLRLAPDGAWADIARQHLGAGPPGRDV